MGESGRPAIAFFNSMNEAIMKIVGFVLWYAPFGIMSLVAAKLGQARHASPPALLINQSHRVAFMTTSRD